MPSMQFTYKLTEREIMKSSDLDLIRDKAVSYQDWLQIFNIALSKFPPSDPVFDPMMDCTLVLDDLLNNHPTLDDLPAQRADFKRRSDGEAAMELQRGMLDAHKSMMAVMRGYP